MKRLILIVWLLVAGLYVHCQSQEARSPRELQPMAEWANSLQVNQLNADQLHSFEQQAIRKLRDVFGYLQLMQNDSLDEAFRKRARSLASQSFSNDSSFFYFLQANQQQNTHIEVLETQPFQKYYPTSSLYISRIKFAIGSDEQLIMATLTKINKQFGKEKRQVWEIRFVYE